MSEDQPCSGFPDDCSNVIETEVSIDGLGGGIACGCGPEELRAERAAEFMKGGYAVLEKMGKALEDAHRAFLELSAHVVGAGVPVHAVPPPGSGLMPCCKKTPFEVSGTDRMTNDPDKVTCGAERASASMARQGARERREA